MKDLLTRRNILIGAGGAVVVAGGVFEASRLLRKRYAPSAYDDLLKHLEDRDQAIAIGEAVLAETGAFDTKAVADKLRARLAHGSWEQVTGEDAAAGRILEAHGWVLPESLALLCALAAKASV